MWDFLDLKHEFLHIFLDLSFLTFMEAGGMCEQTGRLEKQQVAALFASHRRQRSPERKENVFWKAICLLLLAGMLRSPCPCPTLYL